MDRQTKGVRLAYLAKFMSHDYLLLLQNGVHACIMFVLLIRPNRVNLILLNEIKGT